MNEKDVVIIGGGIAGLTAAHEIKKQDRSVLLLEKSNYVGGAIRSERKSGFLIEFGPNTVQSSPDFEQLIIELGLQNEILLANSRIPRYILHKNLLHKVPLSPLSLFSTKLLSASGRLRLLREPFIPAGLLDKESVFDFFSRRLGSEIAEKLVAPFISGIWAGDATQLELASAFPKLNEWEKKYGSILKGLLHSRKGKKASTSSFKGLISFRNGLATVVQRLEETLRQNIKFGCNTHKLINDSKNWLIETDHGNFKTKAVILALPAYEGAALLQSLSPATSDMLTSIPYAPVTLIHLGFSKSDIPHPIEGFGYLVCPTENEDVLGCLWSSSIFPDRAEKNHVLLTVFVGGATRPELTGLSKETILERVKNHLKKVLKIKNPPLFTEVTTYKKGIPQYNQGHEKRKAALLKFEQEFPGIHFVGNYGGGISVGDVIKNAKQVAQKIT